MLKIAMLTLNSMLKRAARTDEWKHVVHRCAWCKRAFDERGDYSGVVVLAAGTVATDGMCPPCGTRALAQLATRRPLRERLAA